MRTRKILVDERFEGGQETEVVPWPGIELEGIIEFHAIPRNSSIGKTL